MLEVVAATEPGELVLCGKDLGENIGENMVMYNEILI